MRDYRKDKFKVGDVVEWVDEYATLIEARAEYGHGPFTIVEVKDRPFEAGDDHYQSNWSSMGHTQHVIIDAMDDQGMPGQFSGAYFHPLAREPSP